MWPTVWPGTSMHLRTLSPQTATVSPSASARSSGGRRWASAAAPITRAPCAQRSASTPVDVVAVVVGDEDVRSSVQPRRVERGPDRRGLGRVHQGGGAGRLVVEQIGVVVLEARDGDEREGRGGVGHCVRSSHRQGRRLGSGRCSLARGRDSRPPGRNDLGIMHLDVLDLRDFYYRTPLGRAAQRVHPRRAARALAATPGADGGGLRLRGAAAAALSWREARRVIALMPGPQGVMPWPAGEPNVARPRARRRSGRSRPASSTGWSCCTASRSASTPTRCSRRCWRVLAPGGRAVFIVPNRTGLWARRDATPFGYGRPYSLGQLEALLRRHRFATERPRCRALRAAVARAASGCRRPDFWERIGRHLPSAPRAAC